MLETLLTNYGYPILTIGTFLEGETIMVLGGLFAHLGYLSLPWVIVCGFCGTLCGDQLYFFLGRRHGKGLLTRHPAWQARTDTVLEKLERHQTLHVAACQGLILGAVIGGITVRDNSFAGSLWDWVHPFPMLVAAGVVCGYALLGATFLIIKMTGEIQRRTYRRARLSAWAVYTRRLSTACLFSCVRLPALRSACIPTCCRPC